MEETHKHSSVPSCMIKGPGPKYKLASLTGYIDHDPSHRKNPAYSIRKRTWKTVYSNIPGPKYAVYQLTNRGPVHSPAYTIGVKFFEKIQKTSPSPAEYKAEQVPPVNHEKRSPAYTIPLRPQTKLRADGPGPNQYMLPTCIGPKVPNKKAQAAFSMTFTRPTKLIEKSPGPAAYEKVKVEVIKRNSPAYSMKWRQRLHKKDYVPGPSYDGKFNSSKKAPAFSFGVKHSQCAGIPITAHDDF